MNVIELHHPFDPAMLETRPTALAMGFFDGLHQGHRAVIEAAKIEAEAQGLELAVLTYDHHASVVFEAHDQPLQYLTTIERKLELLADMGVETVYLVNFTAAFSAQTPQQFVDRYLVGLDVKVAVAGFDHTYGKASANADMAHLPEYARGRFDVVEVPEVKVDGMESASTTIRELIDRGDVDAANQMLTEPYQTSGTVVHGEARGREMGYRTANIEGPRDERLPGGGVYVVELAVGGIWYGGMASIGYNVTFGDGRPKTVEINLFDFDANIYGERVQVKWHHYLRGEVKFDGMDGLIAQLANDEQASRQYLATLGEE